MVLATLPNSMFMFSLVLRARVVFGRSWRWDCELWSLRLGRHSDVALDRNHHRSARDWYARLCTHTTGHCPSFHPCFSLSHSPRTHTHTHTHTRIYTRTHTHAYTHTHTHAHTHTHTHTHARTHTHTHTHKHTHTHTIGLPS